MIKNRSGIQMSTAMYLFVCVLFSMALFLAGCQTTGIEGDQAVSQTAEPTEQGRSTDSPTLLVTPYALQPAAGICGEAPDLDVIEAQIWPDIPSPRCLRVYPDQRLRLINHTPETIQWKLGILEGKINPESQETLPEPFGQILAPGVHVLQTSPYSGPEIWVIGE